MDLRSSLNRLKELIDSKSQDKIKNITIIKKKIKSEYISRDVTIVTFLQS